MARVQKVPTAPFSPYYGCAIMLMAVFIFGGIIAWSWYALVTQDKVIASLTVDDPEPLPRTALDEPARTALEQRLKTFANAAQAGQAAELALSLEELNTLLVLAPDTGYGSYAGLLHFEKTDPGNNRLVARISLPMNHIKFWEDRKRYLNGHAGFNIHVHAEGVDAKIVDVEIPGKEVPEGFIVGLEIWTWLAPYRNLEPIGSVLKAVRQAQVTDTGLTLSTTAPAAP
jgi:hypothetical protein